MQTHSNPAAFPSALRAKRALVVKPEDEEFANPLPVVSTLALSTIFTRHESHATLEVSSLWILDNLTDIIPSSICHQIQEKCLKCGETGLSYQDLQLRGVDEGATTFYEVSTSPHICSQSGMTIRQRGGSRSEGSACVTPALSVEGQSQTNISKAVTDILSVLFLQCIHCGDKTKLNN